MDITYHLIQGMITFYTLKKPLAAGRISRRPPPRAPPRRSRRCWRHSPRAPRRSGRRAPSHAPAPPAPTCRRHLTYDMCIYLYLYILYMDILYIYVDIHIIYIYLATNTCIYTSISTYIYAAPAITKPSRSLSKAREAVVGSPLRFVDRAPMQSNIAVNLREPIDELYHIELDCMSVPCISYVLLRYTKYGHIIMLYHVMLLYCCFVIKDCESVGRPLPAFVLAGSGHSHIRLTRAFSASC